MFRKKAEDVKVANWLDNIIVTGEEAKGDVVIVSPAMKKRVVRRQATSQ